MNRRSFFKVLGGLSAAIALPMQAIAEVLPQTWTISAVRWTKAYDLGTDSWIFRSDCWIGKKVGETPTMISIENPIQIEVDVRCATEDMDEDSKRTALRALKDYAEQEIKRLNGIR